LHVTRAGISAHVSQHWNRGITLEFTDTRRNKPTEQERCIFTGKCKFWAKKKKKREKKNSRPGSRTQLSREMITLHTQDMTSACTNRYTSQDMLVGKFDALWPRIMFETLNYQLAKTGLFPLRNCFHIGAPWNEVRNVKRWWATSVF
jgi:hypothetical protein